MEKPKFVVFGAGRMGLFYIRLILDNPDTILAYIVVKSDSTRTKLQSTLNLPSNCLILLAGHEAELYNDSSINAALICSPTHAHEDQVKQCLTSGFSVYCEKPISFSENAIKQCYDLAKQKQLHLFCAFQRRFDASFIKVYETVRSGSLGKLHFIKSCSRDGSLPDINYLKTSGGFFKDSTVHDIDMVCWIAGKLPYSVFAQGHAHRPEFVEINDFDSVTVVLKFQSGLISIIDQDRFSAYGYDQRLEVLGDKGMIQVDNPLLNNCQTYTANGKSLSRSADDFLMRYEQAYKSQFENFLCLLKGSNGTVIEGGHMLAVEKIAEAALLSSRTNRVIEIKNY